MHIVAISIVSLVFIFVIHGFLKNLIETLKLRTYLQYDYSEEDVIKHLEFIINDLVQQYTLLQIRSDSVFYIDKNTQEKMSEYVIDNIYDRISESLLMKLSLIYNKNNLGSIIGEHIYMNINNFVLNYNLNSSNDIANLLNNNTDNKKLSS